jgi:hypothetical protein
MTDVEVDFHEEPSRMSDRIVDEKKREELRSFASEVPS